MSNSTGGLVSLLLSNSKLTGSYPTTQPSAEVTSGALLTTVATFALSEIKRLNADALPALTGRTASSRALFRRRRTVVINFSGEAGAAGMVWTLGNAWPTKIIGADLKSGGNEVAVESVEVAFETMTVQAALEPAPVLPGRAFQPGAGA